MQWFLKHDECPFTIKNVFCEGFINYDFIILVLIMSNFLIPYNYYLSHLMRLGEQPVFSITVCRLSVFPQHFVVNILNSVTCSERMRAIT